MLSGSCITAGDVNSRNLITNNTTMVVNPKIIVTVSVVTMIFSHRMVGGCCNGAGDSLMVASRIVKVEIGQDPPSRLDRALVEYLPAGEQISRTRMTSLIRSGAVDCEGIVASSPSQSAATGQVWRIEVPDPVDSGLAAEEINLDIVHEDSDVLVINKAAGMVVHPARGNWQGTLVNALLHHCGNSLLGVGDVRRPGIVHRLDKDTSGLLVIAKTDRACGSLAKQFEERTISRTYLAAVRGVPDIRSSFSGYDRVTMEENRVLRIEGNIDRDQSNRLKMKVTATGGRHAVTRVNTIRSLAGGHASLIECKLETGRTHQIRVHLEKLGHPLIGDPLYGSGAKLLPHAAGEAARCAAANFGRQALHAVTLEFEHPRSGERVGFKSELPTDFRALLDALTVE